MFKSQAPPVPYQGNRKTPSRQEVLGAGEGCAGMRGNLRGKSAQGGGDELRRGFCGEKGPRDFPPWMPRPRQEVLYEQSDHKKQRQNDAADPPGNRRPPQLHLLLLELKE